MILGKDAKFHQNGASDEYYTLYEEVEYIFNEVIDTDQLKGKIIYLPCDSEDSNFVKYLKEKKEEIHYKELIYTWDDFNTHHDLFEKSDIIITNPPFSKIQTQLIPILNNYKCKFFIFGSLSRIVGYYHNFLPELKVRYTRRSGRFPFRTPWINDISGNEYTMVNNALYIYNIKVKDEYEKECLKLNKSSLFKDRKKKDEVYTIYDGKKYVNFDSLSDIPSDFNEEFLCPCSCLLSRYEDYFEIIDELFYDKLSSRKDYSDGRGRYARCLCRLKKLK